MKIFHFFKTINFIKFKIFINKICLLQFRITSKTQKVLKLKPKNENEKCFPYIKNKTIR